jgi:hypothetical protein
MTIIMLCRLYFMLSCQLIPTDDASVQHGRHTDRGATNDLTGSHPSSGVGSEATWVRLLVGFWCKDTYHVASPDPMSSRDQTCPWNSVCDLPLTSLGRVCS